MVRVNYLSSQSEHGRGLESIVEIIIGMYWYKSIFIVSRGMDACGWSIYHVLTYFLASVNTRAIFFHLDLKVPPFLQRIADLMMLCLNNIPYISVQYMLHA